MSLYKTIDKFRNLFFLRLLYRAARLGLALTFVISGIRKLPGLAFTILPPEDPVGGFFHAMHETGIFGHFIGFFQIAVGLLALFNRFAPLAILLMVPVTVNIWLVSIGLGMRGTPLITSAMLAGNIFLLLWHFEHFRAVLERPAAKTIRLKKQVLS